LAKQEKQEECDVVIVGGGLAGLSAAMRISSLGKKVIVLDATELGGRTKSIVLGDDHISVGGTWCMLEDESILGLAYEVNCLPFIPRVELDSAVIRQMALHPYLLLKLWLLGRNCSPSLEKGEASKEAIELAKISLQQWLDQQSGFLEDQSAKTSVFQWFAMMENEPWDLSRMSTLFAANMIYQRLRKFNETGRLFPQNMRWEGGTGIFVQAIIRKLQSQGVSLRENSWVEKITYSSSGTNDAVGTTEVLYHSSPGETTIKCKYVVVATSPLVAAQIKYSPALPSNVMNLNGSIAAWDDPAYNVVLGFKSKLWIAYDRQRIFLPNPSGMPDPNSSSPSVAKEAAGQVFGVIFDLSPNALTDIGSPTPSGKGYVRFLLDPIRFSASPNIAQVADACLKYLETNYPQLKWREQYENGVIIDWTQKKPWIAVSYYWPPGTTYATDFGLLTKPCHPVYWAGSERSLQGMHWMEGAIRSGNTAAAQVLSAMGRIGSEKGFLRSLEHNQQLGIEEVRKKSSIGSELYQLTGVLENFFNIRNSKLTKLEEEIYDSIHTSRNTKEGGCCLC
jgi:monoamine oxidase